MEEYLDYDAFRELALRTQVYARLNKRKANARLRLVWADLPPIQYRSGEWSDPYSPGFWRSLRLRLVRRPAALDLPELPHT